MVMTKKRKEYPDRGDEIYNSVTSLSLSQIRRDGGTQPRASINHETVREYAEDMKNGDKFPPVIVFYDDAEWNKWSDREIARRCGVGNKFVGDVRCSLCSECFSR